MIEPIANVNLESKQSLPTQNEERNDVAGEVQTAKLVRRDPKPSAAQHKVDVAHGAGTSSVWSEALRLAREAEDAIAAELAAHNAKYEPAIDQAAAERLPATEIPLTTDKNTSYTIH